MRWFSGNKKTTGSVSKDVIKRTDNDLLIISQHFPLGKERSETRIPSHVYFSYNETISLQEVKQLVELLTEQIHFVANLELVILSGENTVTERIICNAHVLKKKAYPISIPDALLKLPMHLTASIVQQLCELRLESIHPDKSLAPDAATVLSFCYGFGIFQILSLDHREHLQQSGLSLLSDEAMLCCAVAAQELALNSFAKYQFYISPENWARLQQAAEAVSSLPQRAEFRTKWHQYNAFAWDYQIIAHGNVYERESIDATTRLLKAKPGDYSLMHYLAYSQLLHGQYAEAIKAFSKIISGSPFFSEAFNNRGLAYMLSGNLSSAFQDLKTAERIEPNSSYNRRNFGIHFLLRAKAKEALDELKEAYRMNSTTEHIHFWIGKAYYALDNAEEARKHFAYSRGIPELPVPDYPF